MTNWDDAFENSAYIPGAEEYPGRWAQQAEKYRASAHNAELDVAYGQHPREKYDLFYPDGAVTGVLVFVHGGYWMKFDKSGWSRLAEGIRARGWAVAIPGYVLTPEVRIADITRQIGAAVTDVCGRVDGPVLLAGHSAGGHLVSRMVCRDGPLDGGLCKRIQHVMSISGLHDLRPLLNTAMNRILRLDRSEARSESAVLQQPVPGLRFTAWVGADERPEFIRQSELLAEIWAKSGAGTECVLDAGHHHFSVIEGLADARSAIVQKLLA